MSEVTKGKQIQVDTKLARRSEVKHWKVKNVWKKMIIERKTSKIYQGELKNAKQFGSIFRPISALKGLC